MKMGFLEEWHPANRHEIVLWYFYFARKMQKARSGLHNLIRYCILPPSHGGCRIAVALKPRISLVEAA
jgi:hypothetical protein